MSFRKEMGNMRVCDAARIIALIFITSSISLGQQQETEIPLVAGWNLISIPVKPADDRIEEVLASVDGLYDSVYSWNNSALRYESYVTDSAEPGDMERLSPGRGYFIHMYVPATLTVKGTAITDPIALTPGWNLVGFNSLILQKPIEPLNSIDGKYSSVWTIDAKVGEYRGFVPPDRDQITWMRPGFGYWIHARDHASWKFPSCDIAWTDMTISEENGAVSIETRANKFPVGALMLVMQVGEKEFIKSQFRGGDISRCVFRLSHEEYSQLTDGDPVLVKYGQEGIILPPSSACRNPKVWYFGPLDKD
jgi:hypothetical protein